MMILCCACRAEAGYLHVKQNYQEETQWCWAGSSQSILEHYGCFLSQTTIADYGTEGANIWNWLWGATTSPTRRGIDRILDHFASLDSDTYSSSLTLQQCLDEIDAGHLFVVRWEWDSGGGHFAVCHGVETNTMYIMDPWYGPTIDDYDWVCRSASRGHTWTHSLTVLSNYVYPESIDLDVGLSPDGFVLDWNSLSSRWYRVWSCASLEEPVWSVVSNEVQAAATTNGCTVPLIQDAAFFRIEWLP
jgi:hypothetical protein